MPDLNVLTELDIAELIVRVNRYEGAGLGIPVSYQAIAKGRAKPTGPWGVGVRSNPNAAVEAALTAYAEIVRDSSRAPRAGVVEAYGGAPSKYGF